MCNRECIEFPSNFNQIITLPSLEILMIYLFHSRIYGIRVSPNSHKLVRIVPTIDWRSNGFSPKINTYTTANRKNRFTQ